MSRRIDYICSGNVLKVYLFHILHPFDQELGHISCIRYVGDTCDDKIRCIVVSVRQYIVKRL